MDSAKTIWDGLHKYERSLLLTIGNPQRAANFAAKTYTALCRARLITDNFPEQLTVLGTEVKQYGAQFAENRGEK